MESQAAFSAWLSERSPAGRFHDSSSPIAKRVPPRSVAELRALVRSEYSQTVCSALLELSRRGEDVSDGIPVIRALLLSDHAYERNIGSII